MGIQRIYIAERMMILTVFIAVFTQKGYTVLAKCIVVAQQQQQPSELSSDGSSEAIDKRISNGMRGINLQLGILISMIALLLVMAEYDTFHNFMSKQVVELLAIIATAMLSETVMMISTKSEQKESDSLAAPLYIDNEKVFENITDVESRWTKIISEATEAHQAKHYKQSLIMSQRPIVKYSDQGINVKLARQNM
ncbi:unnamed protein product [Thelazia callipaeda]|uniref:DUF2721 domain-containing protein n=1 Tax=Thelazia callipaeda TaxID=103827 RepID=A0A0N5CVU2_THECL|nr:unnamed protein product [Thelazia callipaeda]